MDDIQDVSVRTVGRIVDLLAPGGGGRSTAPTPLGYGSVAVCALFKFNENVQNTQH